MDDAQKDLAYLIFQYVFFSMMIGIIIIKLIISKSYRSDLIDLYLLRDMFQTKFFFNHWRFHVTWIFLLVTIPILFAIILNTL